MRVPLILPQLGLTQTEGYVSEWVKKPGDAVEKDEIVFVVSTDKAEMDVESPTDGTMGEILVDAGVTVPVGTPLAWLQTEGDEQPEGSYQSPEPARPSVAIDSQHADVASAPDAAAERASDPFSVSPRARRTARALGVNLDSLQGTGPGGRVVEADVRAAATTKENSPVIASPTPRRASERRRQIIAERMTESIRTIPAFTVSLEVNAAKLVDLYESIGERFVRSTSIKLSYTDLLTKIVALALEQTPELNAVWTDEGARPKTSIDLNLAMATELGVVAPLLRCLENSPLQNIAEARTALMRKAREGHLSIDDVAGGTGTLSNLGMYRVDAFQGIITPDQSFILSLGKIARRPWADGDHLTVRPTLHVTLAVDHRVADGAQAAMFIGRIAELIESPLALLWEVR